MRESCVSSALMLRKVGLVFGTKREDAVSIFSNLALLNCHIWEGFMEYKEVTKEDGI